MMAHPMSASTSEAGLDPRVGTWLRGKYRLDRVIGEGGMAIVYAATHRNKKRFAVKMLQGIASSHTEMQARFLREGYLANTVDHPGAVAVLDDDVSDDGHAFIVMELLEGKTLEDLSPEGAPRPALTVTLNLAFQVLDTLAAAHDKGIVHRDIKPANLFLTRSGQLKLLDFGIARLRDAGPSASSTQTGAMLGTPAYMGPEQALGRTQDVDARTDIWAVGASLFWLFSGRQVHLGDTVQHMLVLAATQTAPPLATVAPDVPPEIAAIVDRALAFDRADRWQTAAAMRDAVDAAYQGIVGRAVVPASLAGVAPLSQRAPAPAIEPPGSAPRVSAPGPAPKPTAPLVATIQSNPHAAVTASDDPLRTVIPVSSSRDPERRTRPATLAASLSALVLVLAVGAWFALRTHASPDPHAGAAGLVATASATDPTLAPPAAPPTGAAASPEPEPLPAATVDRTDPPPTAPVAPRKHPPAGNSTRPARPAAPLPTNNDFDRQ
jgi:serine/threonine protein kinase